jgi:hypothetical protein
MRNHKTGLAALTCVALIAFARAEEKRSVPSWPYGLYDKNIPRQDSCITNSAAERPLKVLYYRCDEEALRSLCGFTNKASNQPSPPGAGITNAVKSAKPDASK